MNKKITSFIILIIFTEITFSQSSRLPDPADVKWVRCIIVDGSSVWGGTFHGIARWDLSDGSYTKYTDYDGLPDNQVHSAVKDPDDA